MICTVKPLFLLGVVFLKTQSKQYAHLYEKKNIIRNQNAQSY